MGLPAQCLYLADGQCPLARLIRARAIENQVWVVAPGGQGGGQNSSRRRTYGHSLICDPWGGKIVSEFDEGPPGMACANLDLEQLHQLRSRMPVWEHRRL